MIGEYFCCEAYLKLKSRSKKSHSNTFFNFFFDRLEKFPFEKVDVVESIE